MDPVLNQVNEKLGAALHHFKMEIAGIRAGRANPALVENVLVDAYNAKMKLVELGTISSPQHALLQVMIWDQSLVDHAVKAIQSSGLGLNPSTEGNIIRLPIPPLTAERREEFIKLLHQKMEEVRVQIRQIRQEERALWDRQKELGEIGEDEFFRREKILQELVDKKIQEIEQLGKAKEEDLIQV